MREISSILSIVYLDNKQYNEIDKISPVSASPLIQLTLSGPSASIAGGLFVLGTLSWEDRFTLTC